MEAAEILEEMARTFRERNEVYGDNYKNVGAVMKSLFPGNVNLNSVDDYNMWHLFELMIVLMFDLMFDLKLVQLIL